MLRRTQGREKTETIIYLAGRDDLDRWIATEKGIPDDRLVAVDRHGPTVAQIRERKVPAVCGRVEDVLIGWPRSTPVCLIHLDFCGGLPDPKDIARLANEWVFNPALTTAILAVNMMRGRESGDANTWRKVAEGAIAHLNRHGPANHPLKMPGGEKHRGAQLAYSLAAAAACDWIKSDDGSMYSPFDTANSLHWMNPKLFTYRSGGLVFDSCVLDPIGRSFCLHNTQAEQTAQQVLRQAQPIDVATQRRVNATLAVRSMRANAHG